MNFILRLIFWLLGIKPKKVEEQVEGPKPRALFIVKTFPSKKYGSGLSNSCRFVCRMLEENGYEVKMEEAIDGNCIDRFVHGFKPQVCFIEAYWVTPAKFQELQRLHRKVKFVVRNHSQVPFLSQEGIAFEWTLAYARIGVEVACNAIEAYQSVKEYVTSHDESLAGMVTYLPNHYPLKRHENRGMLMYGNYGGRTICGQWNYPVLDVDGVKVLNIGCFGAVRPLKNHVNQALAAMQVADQLKMKLNFHVNGSRLESGGSPVFKTLNAIFENHPRHKLIVHGWLTHSDFRDLLTCMDAVMQVSYSETFNVVSADAVTTEVPVVASTEVFWLRGLPKADPNYVNDIGRVLLKAVRLGGRKLHKLQSEQWRSLADYDRDSQNVWLHYMKQIKAA